MKTGKSTPKGGRPPYITEDEDLLLAEKLASFGYSKKAIADALEINESTLYEIQARDSKFSKCIKRGVVNHCLRIEEMYEQGEISPTQYIYWSKTKWRSFYPQENQQNASAQITGLELELINPREHKTAS